MESEKIKVLYVDDEINNLISFKANFRNHYEVHTAESAEEGKKILKTSEIHVLITDQKMPVTSGVQFLESIIKVFPFPVRILLTGYTDIETVIEAVNKGQIYRYIMKPFDVKELKVIIESAYDIYQFRRNNEEALSKYRQLFENSNDAIFMMDDDGFLKELNNFGLNLFKINRSKLNSISLQNLFSVPEDYNNLRNLLVKNKTVIDFPAKIKDTNNNIIEALVSATPMFDEKNLVGYQCMIRDITKQKEMEGLVIRSIIDTQEKERIRFGKNLHDSVGQKLAAVNLFLNEISDYNENAKTNEVISKTTEIINSSINELRDICFNIMPKTLEVLGLVAAINELRRQTELKGSFEFEINIGTDFPKLHIQVELAIFRIVQILLCNSITHGNAKKIELTLNGDSSKLLFAFKDNGKGFNVKEPILETGMGFKNMRSRIQSYNGELKINSAPCKGTEINILIPVSESMLLNKMSANA